MGDRDAGQGTHADREARPAGQVGPPAPAGAVSLRRLSRDDFALLARWLQAPHVARWWAHETTPEAVEADFGEGVDGLEPTEYHVIEWGARPVGLIQRYPMAAFPEYPHEISAVVAVPDGAWSIDYLIGEADALGRGIGSSAAGALVESIWRDDPAASAVVVPIHADNVVSARMLERAGFRRVASGELAPDNPADDRRHHVYRIDRPATAPRG